MVVVTARPMGMAVLDLFRGRVSQGLDRDLEVESLTSQGMIRIDRDRFFADAGDEKWNLPAFIVVREHLHASGELRVLGE